MNISTLTQYIKYIRARGKRCFTKKDVQDALGITPSNASKAIYRLLRKKEIARPFKNFYVIVPPQDSFLGCIPERELLPLLMNHLGLNYYVGLLSAAKYYGASHQKPMEFQVVTNKQLRGIHCGQVKIVFIYKKSLAKIPIKKFSSPTGDLNVSTPEATAMDLLNYMNRSVGINNVSTILSELIEKIQIPKLKAAANISGQKAWLQRMGYILERIDSMVEEHQKTLIYALHNYLSDKKLSYIPLSPSEPRTGFSRNTKWKIIENTTVESDL